MDRSLTALAIPLEHLQHPVRDQKPGDDIRRRGEEGNRAEDADAERVVAAGHEDRADHGDG